MAQQNKPIQPSNDESATHLRPMSQLATLPDTFYLGEWQVDVAANRLRRGYQETRIEAKVMELLVYLANRPAELITREELERDVWAGRVVSYESLTSTINKLRRALNDDSRQPRYVETVSKKGYRLIAPVKAHLDEGAAGQQVLSSAATPNRHAMAMIYTIVAVAVLLVSIILYQRVTTERPAETTAPVDKEVTRGSPMQTPSLVVLPFVDISSEPAQRYLGDGITEDVTTALSKLSGLFVIARSSAMNYKDQAVDIKHVARQLNVHYVVEGSVQREGNKLRVNAKLIDGNTGFHLWAEQYDREVTDIFTVQDNITTKIVKALSVKLTEQEKRRAARRYTVSFAAYDKFLQGQVLYVRHTREDNLRARELYQHSIELDPRFARAYGATALTYTAEYRFGWQKDRKAALTLAQQLAEKAVAIDSQLPQAYWVLGYVYLQQRHYNEAIQAAERAIELNPNFADGYATLGVSYVYSGDPEAGVRMMQRAMRLSPHYPAPYASALGQALYFLRRYDEALPVLREAVDRNVNLLTSHVFLIATLTRLGQKDEANWAVVQFKTLVPDFKVEDVGEMFPIKDQETLQRIMDDLRSAGV